MKNYTINMTISAQQIDDIMASALGNSGIWYWAEDSRVVLNRRDSYHVTSNYQSEALTRGCYLRIKDAETGRWHNLTLKKLLKAFSLYQIDLNDWDGPQADCLVQTALFGEVIHG